MKIGILVCKHCGVKYRHQFSGNYRAVDTPKEYSDEEYCGGCKKVILDALSTVPILFEERTIENKDESITLELLLSWEDKHSQERESQISVGFPIATRIFATSYNTKSNEFSKMGEVIGRGKEHSGKIFYYSYWPSKPQEAIITVKVRYDIENNKIDSFILKR